MHHTPRSLTLLLCLCLTALAGAQTQLNAPDQRLSDAAIHADYQTYAAIQDRIAQLNAQGIAIRDYHLSKAQCWLDVSLHEYTRNDRSDFPQQALAEAEKLIVGLEQKATPLPMDTPLVNGAARLRPDLWARTAGLQQASGFACARQLVACAEVELVHAGNEFNQQQWRHAKPYIQIAEEWLSQADAAAAQCPVAPVAAIEPVLPVQAKDVPPPAAAGVLCAPQPIALTLTTQVLFDFDKFTPEHIRPQSRREFDTMVARVRREGITVGSIRLSGYADRLNSTGNTDYNQQLSQKRVQTVRALLREQGLEVSGVFVDAKGDTEQVTACQARFKRPADLQECLLPNRRVTVELQGVHSVMKQE